MPQFHPVFIKISNLYREDLWKYFFYRTSRSEISSNTLSRQSARGNNSMAISCRCTTSASPVRSDMITLGNCKPFKTRNDSYSDQTNLLFRFIKMHQKCISAHELLKIFGRRNRAGDWLTPTSGSRFRRRIHISWRRLNIWRLSTDLSAELGAIK